MIETICGTIIVVSFIILFGYIGNFMTLIIVSMKHNKSLSVCRYIAGLAVADSLCLTVFILTPLFYSNILMHLPHFNIAFR